jgi:hypothetical protein
MRRRKLITEDQLVVAGYNNGLTLRALSAFYKVSIGTIRNILIANGVNMRPRGRKPKEKKNAPIECTV